MADKITQDLGEANAVMFTNYKRSDGFEVSFTLRNGSGADLMKKFDQAIEAIKAAGGTPLPFKSQGGFSKPEVPMKDCPVHHVPMKQKLAKASGKPYFSHSQGVFPNLDMCFGQGYKSEMGQSREPYDGAAE